MVAWQKGAVVLAGSVRQNLMCDVKRNATWDINGRRSSKQQAQHVGAQPCRAAKDRDLRRNMSRNPRNPLDTQMTLLFLAPRSTRRSTPAPASATGLQHTHELATPMHACEIQ
jgi:hypothetical protein